MLTKYQKYVLCEIARGHFLKSHRELDGTKVFKLYRSADEVEMIRLSVVKHLRSKGLIDSNKKFPVSTFWLTEEGREKARIAFRSSR